MSTFELGSSRSETSPKLPFVVQLLSQAGNKRIRQLNSGLWYRFDRRHCAALTVAFGAAVPLLEMLASPVVSYLTVERYETPSLAAGESVNNAPAFLNAITEIKCCG